MHPLIGGSSWVQPHWRAWWCHQEAPWTRIWRNDSGWPLVASRWQHPRLPYYSCRRLCPHHHRWKREVVCEQTCPRCLDLFHPLSIPPQSESRKCDFSVMEPVWVEKSELRANAAARDTVSCSRTLKEDSGLQTFRHHICMQLLVPNSSNTDALLDPLPSRYALGAKRTVSLEKQKDALRVHNVMPGDLTKRLCLTGWESYLDKVTWYDAVAVLQMKSLRNCP